MPSLIRRVAGAGVAVLFAISLTAVASAGTPFTVSNSASFLAGAVPRGALLSIFTGRVSDVPRREFNPWVPTAPDGLFVAASCGPTGDLMRLPILFVGFSGAGTQINVYYPNQAGPEPFGRCADEGQSQIQVHPAPGHGAMMELAVTTVRGHPGIFSVGGAPVGRHIDGYDMFLTTDLWRCNDRLPADIKACPVRTNTEPAYLEMDLTGTDIYVCDPCGGSPLVFEIAPVDGAGNVGTYTPLWLTRLVRDSLGKEKATVMLGTDTAGAEYRLRVRTTERSEVAPSLRLELGPPLTRV